MRRQYLTHPQFQISFTISFVIGIVLIFAVLGGTTLATLTLLGKDPALPPTQKIFFSDNMQSLAKLLCIVGFICVVGFAAVGFYLSYKFVGPLYRVENWLEERMKNKDFIYFQIRPGDELESVVNYLNRMVSRMVESRKEKS